MDGVYLVVGIDGWRGQTIVWRGYRDGDVFCDDGSGKLRKLDRYVAVWWGEPPPLPPHPSNISAPHKDEPVTLGYGESLPNKSSKVQHR